MQGKHYYTIKTWRARFPCSMPRFYIASFPCIPTDDGKYGSQVVADIMRCGCAILCLLKWYICILVSYHISMCLYTGIWGFDALMECSYQLGCSTRKARCFGMENFWPLIYLTHLKISINLNYFLGRQPVLFNGHKMRNISGNI